MSEIPLPFKTTIRITSIKYETGLIFVIALAHAGMLSIDVYKPPSKINTIIIKNEISIACC